MQTYFAVDFSDRGLDGYHMSLAEYVAPGQVHIIAYSAGPDYTMPSMEESLAKFMKMCSVPTHMLTTKEKPTNAQTP
jgi:hypothetical protein